MTLGKQCGDVGLFVWDRSVFAPRQLGEFQLFIAYKYDLFQNWEVKHVKVQCLYIRVRVQHCIILSSDAINYIMIEM